MSKLSDYVKTFVIHKLRTNDKWALHALEVIAANQTIGEYNTERTTENNGIGFNGRDAKMLTSIAKFYTNRKHWAKNHGKNPNIVSVTRNQMVAVHKMIFKYWKQVVNAADSGKLMAMVSQQEIDEMNKIPEDKLPLHIMKKWIFDETKLAFLKRLESEQLVLDLKI